MEFYNNIFINQELMRHFFRLLAVKLAAIYWAFSCVQQGSLVTFHLVIVNNIILNLNVFIYLHFYFIHSVKTKKLDTDRNIPSSWMKGNRKKKNLISEPFTQRNTFTLGLNKKKQKHPQQHKECQNINNNNNYNNNHKIK